jgi:RHS repeat-associated protein
LGILPVSTIARALPQDEGSLGSEEIPFEEYENPVEEPDQGETLIEEDEQAGEEQPQDELPSEEAEIPLGDSFQIDESEQISSGNPSSTSGLSTLAATGGLIEPSLTITWDGRTYAAFDVATQWRDADAFCRSLGGHLVTITSSSEQNVVLGLSRTAGLEYTWIGLEHSRGYWRWVTSEAFGYSNLIQDPGGSLLRSRGALYVVKGKAERTEGTESLYSWDVPAGMWTEWTVNTSGSTGFVCEWEPNSNPPVAEQTQTPSAEDVFWADPVDLSTGAQVIDLNYLDQSSHIPFSLDLTYRSDKSTFGEMGRGWSHNYERRVLRDGDHYRYFSSPSTYIEFEYREGGFFAPVSAPGCEDWTIRLWLSSGNFETELICGYDEIMRFDEAGRLLYIKNRTGDRLTLSYDGALTTVRDHMTGNLLILTHDERGLLVKAESQKDQITNATVTFGYDNASNLASITDPVGNTSSYAYNASGLIWKGTDPNGITYLTNTYDTEGRVITQDDGLQDGYVTTFSYETTSSGRSEVTVIDREENAVVFTFDSKQRLLSFCDQDGNTTEYTYDADGNRKTETDANGNTTTYEYDAYGRTTSKVDPLGAESSATYDEFGNMTSATAADGTHTINTFDTANRLTSTIDVSGAKTEFTYVDSNIPRLSAKKMDDGRIHQYRYYPDGRLSQESDGEGNYSRYYTYDLMGNVASSKIDYFRGTFYEYDAAGNLTTEIDALGNETRFTYDFRGNILSVTDPLDGVITYTYDANGRLIEVTDAMGATISYRYDAEGRLVEIEDAEGRITERTYSYAGRLLSEADALGNTTSYSYDNVGNLICRQDPTGNSEWYAYDACNRMIMYTDDFGNETEYAYDECGRITQITDAQGNITSYAYDELGNVISVEDALGEQTFHEYDVFGNLLSSTDPEGNIRSYTYNKNDKIVSATAGETTYTYEYDIFSNLVSTTAPEHYGATTHTYDAKRQLLSTKDASGHTSSQAYDENGNLVLVTNALEGQTGYSYDELNRLVASSTPSGGALIYGYDATGLLIESTNAREDIRTYDYDAAGRLIGFSDAEGDTEYTYNAYGKLLSATDEAGTIFYEYDELGRLVETSDVYGNTMRYAYDRVGNLVKLDYPNGHFVTYAYDALGQMTSVTDWLGNETFYEYDGAGNLIQTTRPNGTVLYQQYDDESRLISTRDEAPDETLLDEITIFYDHNLNRMEYSLAQNRWTPRYYDEVGRLKEQMSVPRSGGRDSWEYYFDATGNIVDTYPETYTHTQMRLQMAYDDQNRLIELNGQEVTYDADGNMTSYELGNTTTSFSYDSANRLISANNTSYTYDAADNRISRTDETDTTYYTYDATQDARLLASTDALNNTAYHIYGIGLIGTITPSDDYLTYHFDPRGSVTMITDEDAEVTDTFNYNPYGKLIGHQGYTVTPFHFNGRFGVMDDGDGLLYMRARYYSPELMRFINADILTGTIRNPATLNRYVFANGNPVSYIDPFGMSATLITGAHTVLDMAGLIPGFGMIFDGINGIWYVVEGDWVNAGLSAVSFVPIVGDVAGGARLGVKVVKAVEAIDSGTDAAKTAQMIISTEKRAGINSVFPKQWLNSTLDEIAEAARQGDRTAQTARKLLTDNRFNK